MYLPSTYYNQTPPARGEKAQGDPQKELLSVLTHVRVVLTPPTGQLVASAASADPLRMHRCRRSPWSRGDSKLCSIGAASRWWQKECQTCMRDKAPPYHHVIICCHGEIPLNFHPPACFAASRLLASSRLPRVNTRSWEWWNSEGQECCYIWHRLKGRSSQLRPPPLPTPTPNKHSREGEHTHTQTLAWTKPGPLHGFKASRGGTVTIDYWLSIKNLNTSFNWTFFTQVVNSLVTVTV